MTRRSNTGSETLHSSPLLLGIVSALCTTLPLRAADRVVDAAAGPNTYPTIAAAMAVSAPGDRILVEPGQYPAFLFERGVQVIGLGSTPADVTIARVDFHVSTPNLDYDAVLSNVTLCGSNPLDAISISGNELARGTLVLDGVRTCGGVFLAGDAEFQLVAQNTRIEPAPGGGFLGAAFDFGGGRAELVDVLIRGWDAEAGIAAADALRLSRGASVRATACALLGGAGTNQEGQGLADGGDGVTSRPSSAPARLALIGGTNARGGDGASSSGEGGAGVRVRGAIVTGQATVQGGAGNPPGAAWALDGATALGYDPALSLAGGQAPSGIGVGAHSVRWLAGDLLAVTSDPSLASGASLTLFSALDPAAPAPWGSLSGATSPRRFPLSALAVTVPGPAPSPSPRPRLFLYFQAVLVDPLSGQTVHSNPVVVRIDG